MFGWSAETWGVIIALAVSVGYPILQMWTKGTAKNEADDVVGSLRRTVIDHDRRIIRIEKDIEALPQVGEVKRLSEKISDIAGDVKAMAVEVRSLHEGQIRSEKQLQIVTENLMEAGK